jgi:release factor glutamine methyltransferase
VTVAETLRAGAQRLAAAGIDNPRLESRLLLAHAIGGTSEELIRDLTAQIGPSGFSDLIARRAAREPLAFILGWREFWSLRLDVSPATLIPRSDSEAIVAAALAAHPDVAAAPRVVDLGTGTGCLLLAFLHERPRAFGIGVDLSDEAAKLARRNALALGLATRSAFVRGNWAAAIGGRFDLVLSNPPYIATADRDSLMPEVGRYEPALALDGGSDGLAAYRSIIGALPRLLAPAGSAVLEVGIGQFEAVAAIAWAAGLRSASHPDMAGVARAIVLRR